MKSFAAIMALAALTLPSLAQFTTRVILNATAITRPSSNTPAVTGLPTQVCNATLPLCPACDRKNITDPLGTTFEVFCDYVGVSSAEETVDGYVSLQICMEACDEADNCGSINFSPNGSCALTVGELDGLVTSSGYINLLPIATRVTSTSTPQVTGTRSHSVTGMQPTASAEAHCDLASDNLCPTCDRQYVTDTNGTLFHIYCDNDLYSEGSYAIQRQLSPLGCLAQCDNFEWCRGATYYPEGNCDLARGDDVFPETNPGYTAFIPVVVGAVALVPSSTQISAFPTGRLTSVSWNQTSGIVSAAPAPTNVPSACGMPNFSCPACDGALITDGLNQTYRGFCGISAVCEMNIPQPHNTSLDLCLQHCDSDATCMSTLWTWTNHTCTLCQETVDANPVNSSSYVVFQPYHASAPASRLSLLTMTATPAPSLVNTTASMTFYSSASTVSRRASFNPGGPIINITRTASTTLATSSATAIIGFDAEITGITCPLYDADVVRDPSDGGYIEIMCGSGFAAASSQYTTASNFEACAALCTPGCDGIQFSSTSCGLYSAISVVGPSSGWTAGASITLPQIPTASTRPTSSSGARLPAITATIGLGAASSASSFDWAALETDTALTTFDLYTNTVVSAAASSPTVR